VLLDIIAVRVEHSARDLDPCGVERAVVVKGNELCCVEWGMRTDGDLFYGDGSIAAMGRIFRPEPSAKACVAIVVSRFNEALCAQLLEGALAKLHEYDGQADVYWVPGAFEIPQACNWLLAENSNYKGICTLGCLIRGDTDHYSVLASEVTRRLGELSCAGAVPIAFGVLTCRKLEQAEERADPARENKGGEVMQSLLEMIDLKKAL
jgi:6,7-dimethyl-8-ribityllumazine synthase